MTEQTHSALLCLEREDRPRSLILPIISTFYGIVIRLFYREHEPAHFHAEHSGQQAKCDFDGHLIAGEIRSIKARQRIRQWAHLHRAQLEANWEKMKAGQPLETVEPLAEEKQ